MTMSVPVELARVQNGTNVSLRDERAKFYWQERLVIGPRQRRWCIGPNGCFLGESLIPGSREELSGDLIF